MKRTILIVASIVIVLGLLGYSAYVYEYYRQPAPTISTAQAVKQRDEANRLLTLHDAVNQRVQADLSTQVSATQAKLLTACAALKTTKVTSPACP